MSKKFFCDFEEIHRNFDGSIPGLCSECGGECERNSIVVLLPGEADFMARKMNMPDFVEKHCIVVSYRGHEIHLLNKVNCSFLKSFQCKLEKYGCKPITCMFYPMPILGEKIDPGKLDSDEIAEEAAVYFLSSGEVTPFEVELINSAGDKSMISNQNGPAEVVSFE